jgi:hypothetical protein
MRLDLTVYAGLMVAGLGLAYWASLPVEEGEAEKVALVSYDPNTIQTMSFHSKDVDAVATRREDKKFVVDFRKVDELPPSTPPASGTGSGSAPKPAPTESKEHFQANENLDQLAQTFNPLSAMRIVAQNPDDKQLEDFGLKERSDYFALKTDQGKTFKIFLGKRSYGTKNRFALEEGGTRVLLLDDEGFDNLEKANLRAFDRRLYDFEMADVTAAVIKANGKEKRMAHSQRDKSGELIWTDDDEKAPQKQQYDAWMDRLSKLRIASYGSDEDQKRAAAAPPLLEVTFEGKSGVRDTVVIRKVMDGDKPVHFVTSNYLKTQAKLVPARVEPLEKDTAQIVGGG